MSEHKQNSEGSRQKNDRHGPSSSHTGWQKPTMDNATKLLFMSVLVIMCGALLSMVQGAKVIGYIVAGVGLAWYLILRFIPLWRDWRTKRGR